MIIVRHQYTEELLIDGSEIEVEYEDEVAEDVYTVKVSATYHVPESELLALRRKFSRAEPEMGSVSSISK